MISREYLFRSARLMSASGELRPGYLQSDSSDFEGGHTAPSVEVSGKKKYATRKYRFNPETRKVEITK